MPRKYDSAPAPDFQASRVEFALWCARAIGPVFRCVRNGKPPQEKGWQKEATTDEATIREWFDRPNPPNIGIATGGASCIVVVDLDRKDGKEGDKALTALAEAHGTTLAGSKTLIVATPSGGMHLFYRVPAQVAELTGNVGALGEGIDIRAAGNLVVGAGSTIDGKSYRVGIDAPIADMPQWLIDAFVESKAPKVEARKLPDGVEVPGDDLHDIAQARAYLAEVQGIDGYDNAMAIGRRLGDFGILPETAAQLFDDEINPRLPAGREWDMDELVKKMNDWSQGRENAFGSDCFAATVDQNFGDLDYRTPEEIEAEAADAEVQLLEDIGTLNAARIDALIRKHAANGGALMLAEDARADDDDAFRKALAAMISVGDLEERHAKATNLKPLIQGVAIRNTLITLIAPPKAGKTSLAYDIGACVAMGRPWCGREVAHGVYLHILCEGQGGALNRVKALKLAKGIPDDAPFHVLPMSIDLSEPKKKTSANLVIKIAKHLEKMHGLPVQIIAIDTLSRAGAGDENTEALGKVIKQLDYIRAATGATVFGLHHTGIADPMRSRGGSILTGAIDGEILLVDRKTIRFQNMRDFEEPDPITYQLVSAPTDWVDGNGDAIHAVTIKYDDPAEEFEDIETAEKDADILRQVQERFAACDTYRKDWQHEDWGGNYVAELMGEDIGEGLAPAERTKQQKAARARVKARLDKWVKDGHIEVKDRKVGREGGRSEMRPFYAAPHTTRD